MINQLSALVKCKTYQIPELDVDMTAGLFEKNSRHTINMGWTITPVRKSAKARVLSRMLHGFCKEGVLITVTMRTRLLRIANMARDPLTVTSIISLR